SFSHCVSPPQFSALSLHDALPISLCGVAEAKMSASVVGARVRASWLFWVPAFVALWISSMTTASQVTFSSCARYFRDFKVSMDTMTFGKYENGLREAGSFWRTR